MGKICISKYNFPIPEEPYICKLASNPSPIYQLSVDICNIPYKNSIGGVSFRLERLHSFLGDDGSQKIVMHENSIMNFMERCNEWGVAVDEYDTQKKYYKTLSSVSKDLLKTCGTIITTVYIDDWGKVDAFLEDLAMSIPDEAWVDEYRGYLSSIGRNLWIRNQENSIAEQLCRKSIEEGQWESRPNPHTEVIDITQEQKYYDKSNYPEKYNVSWNGFISNVMFWRRSNNDNAVVTYCLSCSAGAPFVCHNTIISKINLIPQVKKVKGEEKTFVRDSKNFKFKNILFDDARNGLFYSTDGKKNELIPVDSGALPDDLFKVYSLFEDKDDMKNAYERLEVVLHGRMEKNMEEVMLADDRQALEGVDDLEGKFKRAVEYIDGTRKGLDALKFQIDSFSPYYFDARYSNKQQAGIPLPDYV